MLTAMPFDHVPNRARSRLLQAAILVGATITIATSTPLAVAQNGVPTEGVTADGRQWVLRRLDEERGPIYDIGDNCRAAISTSTDVVRWLMPYNLDGAGWTVGVWEPGGKPLTTHVEFGGRLTAIGYPPIPPLPTNDHATHVCGTIGAAGLNAQALGMAPSVALVCRDTTNDTGEMNAVAWMPGIGGTIVSNHSYGSWAGWDWDGAAWTWWGQWGTPLPVECYLMGKYTDDVRAWDEVLFNNPYLLAFKSAGNERNDGPPLLAGTPFSHWQWNPGTGQWQWAVDFYDPLTHPDGDGVVNGGYDTLPEIANAKNVLTVGAVSDAVTGSSCAGVRDVSLAQMTVFSSWGPTDDGRIKPDIVANGLDVFSCGAASNSAYVLKSGTSMAAPNASGSAVLLQQLHDQTHGQPMLASTLKGLIIHTADDLEGWGPDYRNGWGLMNTDAAAAMIEDDLVAPHRIQEMTISAGQTITLDLIHTGSGPIRVTMCWTDPPPQPWQIPAWNLVDDPTPMLVNDLDFELLRPNGAINRPWILDPNNPGNGGTFGFNHVDNVERFDDPFSPPAGAYTLTISHTGPLTGGSQDFSLLLTGLEPVTGACCVPVGGCSVQTPPDCLALGGVYAGNSATCAAAACPPPGACCDGAGACSVITQAACASIGGTFSGQGTACATHTCDVFQFDAPVGYAAGTDPTALIAFDMDLDGDLDLAVGDTAASPKIWILENVGGSFVSHSSISLPFPGVRDLEAADLDADGDLDLAVADPVAVRIFRNNGSSFSPDWQFGISDARVVIAADLDGDCTIDLAAASGASAPNQNIFAIRNIGGGFSAPSLTGYSAASDPRGMAAADVNGDGDVDLVVVNEAVGTLLPNDGSGGFPTTWNGWNFSVGLGFACCLSDVALADLDGDGTPEAIVTHRDQDKLVVLRYVNISGTYYNYANPVSYDLADMPEKVITADFDGDGDLDVAVACIGGSRVQLLANNGGTLGQAEDYFTSVGPSNLAAADVDGDGALDLEVTVLNTHQVQVLRNLTDQDCNANGTPDQSESTSSMTFFVAGTSNASDCSWRIVGPGYDLTGTLCVAAGAGGEGYATALVQSINGAGCPGLRACREFGLPAGFTVSAPGAGLQLCIGSPPWTCCFPAAASCTCNPLIERFLLSGEDCNANGMDDTIDLYNGTSVDDDANGVLDECEQATAWIESFDTYPAGPLAGQGGWAPWDGDPAAADFEVAALQSLSPPHSLAIDGADDAVRPFTGITSGRWVFTAHVRVPVEPGPTQYFILLNTYPTAGPGSWSLALGFDRTAGVVRDVDSGATAPLVAGQWSTVRVEIDLDAGVQSIYYENALLITRSWYAENEQGGALRLAAVDLWGNGSLESVFYDGLTLVATPGVPGDVNGDGSVNVEDLVALIVDWGCVNPPGPCPADVNGDGFVDVVDLVSVLLNWGASQ